jgi:hypothetical protein
MKSCTNLLSHLRLRTDASEAAWRDHVRDIIYAAGVRADETAFRLRISEVREWVKTSRIEKRAADISEAIERLGIRVQDPFTVLAIKALDEGLFFQETAGFRPAKINAAGSRSSPLMASVAWNGWV